MTGLDTNILVRYVTQDDDEQFRAVLGLLNQKEHFFFVPNLVLVELDWVLSSVYGWTPEEIAETIARLLTIHNLAFEDEGQIRGSLKDLREGADLSDSLIASCCLEQGCRELATFDKAFAKRHPKFVFTPK